MHRHGAATAIVLAIGLSGFSPLAAEEGTSESPGLVPRLKWVQFEIILGRVRAVRPRFVTTKTHRVGNPLVGLRESLTVSVRANRPIVQYELLDTEMRMTVDLEGESLTIVRQPLPAVAGAAVRYHQPQRGPIQLTITAPGADAVAIRADSLWHLLLIDPAMCREHLLPLLGRVRPDWRLIEKASRVEDALFRVAKSGWLPDRSQWSQLVEQLGSSTFSERQAADAQLRQAGQALLPYLDSLDVRQLDSEQRIRVHHIRLAMSLERGDQPEQVARWLVEDKAAWFGILSHSQPLRCREAVAHMQRICEAEIRFDPEANPSQRAEQLSRLRFALGK